MIATHEPDRDGRHRREGVEVVEEGEKGGHGVEFRQPGNLPPTAL